MLMSSRFIPELDWYQLVEQNISDDVRPIQCVLYINISISAIVTLLILGMVLFVVKRSQQQMETIAGTDTLTGLLNRQAFEMIFQQAIPDSTRRSPLCAVLFDIDYFKLFNDKHGHLAGDRILQEIATITKTPCAKMTSHALVRRGISRPAERLPATASHRDCRKKRQAIASHDFALRGGDILLTVSLGIAEYTREESPADFFTCTDKALYQAKTQGRNRIAVSPTATAKNESTDGEAPATD